MTTAVTNQTEKQIARPLNVLVPLIKEDLRRADEAAERAAEPFKMAASQKFAEARSQQTYSQYVSWVHRHFDVRETQAREYLSLGRYKENYSAAAPQSTSLNEHLRSIGRNRPTSGAVRREWQQPVDEIAERARRDLERIREENLSRAEERDAQRKLALRLIDIGWKVLSKELHPDRGGSRDAMARLNQVRDRLKSHA